MLDARNTNVQFTRLSMTAMITMLERSGHGGPVLSSVAFAWHNGELTERQSQWSSEQFRRWCFRCSESKRGWTRGRRWVTRTHQWVDTCAACLAACNGPRRRAKTPVNNANIHYTYKHPLSTIVYAPLVPIGFRLSIFLLSFSTVFCYSATRFTPSICRLFCSVSAVCLVRLDFHYFVGGSAIWGLFWHFIKCRVVFLFGRLMRIFLEPIWLESRFLYSNNWSGNWEIGKM